MTPDAIALAHWAADHHLPNHAESRAWVGPGRFAFSACYFSRVFLDHFLLWLILSFGQFWLKLVIYGILRSSIKFINGLQKSVVEHGWVGFSIMTCNADSAVKCDPQTNGHWIVTCFRHAGFRTYRVLFLLTWSCFVSMYHQQTTVDQTVDLIVTWHRTMDPLLTWLLVTEGYHNHMNSCRKTSHALS